MTSVLRLAVMAVVLPVMAVFATHAASQQTEREGNFDIRFEPTAKLQTGTPVPFQIIVKDSLRKPAAHAKVTLQIEDQDSGQVEVFRATEVEAGTYIAKPVFHSAGQWSIYVEVTREGAKSARTLQFPVSN